MYSSARPVLVSWLYRLLDYLLFTPFGLVVVGARYKDVRIQHTGIVISYTREVVMRCLRPMIQAHSLHPKFRQYGAFLHCRTDSKLLLMYQTQAGPMSFVLGMCNALPNFLGPVLFAPV